MAATKKTKTKTAKSSELSLAAAYYAEELAKLAKLDVHRPAAYGVRPLFRIRLVDPVRTTLGFHLIDILAVIPGERERGSQHTFATYICLALASDATWTPHEICGYEGALQMEDCYEVVS